MPNTDPNAGTPPEGGEAPIVPEAPAAGAAGTPVVVDEVTTLRSRNAGLDAKVSALLTQTAAEKARADAAEARALALAEAKENGDAELRAELERTRAENARVAQEAKLARIEAKYPETFGVLGAAAVSLTDDQLAASEARMAGVASGTPEVPETPKPVGNNPGRTQAAPPKALEDMSASELEAHLKAFDPSVMFRQ